MAASTDRIHVLHVEDEPDFAEMAAAFIEREDERFDVETASTASKGLDRLGENGFDCVVSDFDMPGKNGIEFLEAVRESHPELPFILFTGKGSEEVASEAISAGVTDYLQKESGTSQYEVLANRITNAVEQRRAREKVAETERRLQTIAENTQDILWKFTADWDELLFINSPYERVWGRSIDELREDPRSFLEGVHPEDRTLVEEAMSQLSAGETVDVKFRVNADERYGRWIRAQGQPVFEEGGEVGKVVGYARDITERRERRRRLETLISNLPGIVYRCQNDSDWPMEFVRGDCESLTGYSEDALEEGRVVWGQDILHPDDSTEIWEAIQDALDEDRPFEVTYRIQTKDGATKWVWERGQLVDSEMNDEQVLEGFITDITEPKRREQQLLEEQAFNQLALESVLDFFWRLDTDGFVIDWSDDGSVTGYPSETAVGMHATEFFPEDERDYIEEKVNELLETGSVTAEVELQKRNGDLVPYRFDGTVLTDENGEVETLCGFGQDISEQVERERELREERDYTEQLIETIPDVFYVAGTDGTLREWNERITEVTGRSPDEIADGHAIEFFAEEHRNRVGRAIEETLTTGQATVEADILTAEGDRIPYEFTGSRLTDSEGDLIGLVGIGRDISERKTHEAELKRYETLVEASGDPMYMLDPDGHFEYVNEALVEISGYENEALIGAHVRKVLNEEDIRSGEELIGSLVASDDRQGTFEMEFSNKDGGSFPAENHISLIYEDGAFQGTVGVLRDITDRLERERRLQRERDRLDEFAGILSHDLRNPLNVAEGRLTMAMEECESEHLEPVARAHHRMKQLVDDMLSLARAGEAIGKTDTVEMAELADACWRNVQTESATLHVETEATIQADESRIQQMLENLLRNAIEHGGDDVMVTVGDLSNGFYVEDDGPGIPSEDRDSVFEPGYSSSTGGTGYGLAIVRDIAEAHGWNIAVTEGSDGGARFEFTGLELSDGA